MSGSKYANETVSFGEALFQCRDLGIVPALLSRKELEFCFAHRMRPSHGMASITEPRREEMLELLRD